MYKFNPQNFAAKDGLRPGMNGVRYENGYQVASDGYILCVIREPYPKEYEGKTVDKYGEMNDGKFPDWKRLIPKSTENMTEVELDLAKFDEFVKDARTLVKENKIIKGRGVKSAILVKIGSGYFKLELFKQIVALMRHIGTNKIIFRNNCVPFVEKDGNYGLIMPYLASVIEGYENIKDDNGYYFNRVYTLA